MFDAAVEQHSSRTFKCVLCYETSLSKGSATACDLCGTFIWVVIWHEIVWHKTRNKFVFTYLYFFLSREEIVLLLFKPATQDQVGKTKLFINYFRNPTSTCATRNWKSTTQGSNQSYTTPETHLTFRCQTQCREGHSTHGFRQAGNTLQIGTF